MHVYDHESGVREEFPAGSGRPVLRPAGMSPPCESGPGVCAKVSPNAGVELNDRNQETYRHYLECRAVGNFPDDPVVREHAAIIRSVEDAADRIERRENAAMMRAYSMAAGTTGAFGGREVFVDGI